MGKPSLPNDDASRIELSEARTLPALFNKRVARTPDGLAYQQYDPGARRWVDYSWREVDERVSRWRAAINQEQLEKGDRVAMLLRNGLDWICFDQAATSLGLVVVPFYVLDVADNFAFFLKDTAARLLVVEHDHQWHDIEAIGLTLPHLKRVICTEHANVEASDLVMSLQDWIGSAPLMIDTGRMAPKPEDLATIVYTSGTTGRAKGVQLSHENLLSGISAVMDRVPGFTTDRFISYLPLAHIFERTVGYYLPIACGAGVGFARSIRTLSDDLQIIRPTIFIGVPRVYERALNAIREKTEGRKFAKRLLRATEQRGWQRFQAEQREGGKQPVLDRLVWYVLNRLVASRISARFGGRVRLAVTGGAPMSTAVARFFVAIGFPLIEGYGLAEAGAPVCGNALDDNVLGSIGRPFKDVEIKIGDDSELLVRGPSVMQGYWHQPEQTRRTIDRDGWLHTGDIADIVDGRVFLKGRLKDILVTSTGENVAPHALEAAIIGDVLFKQAMVVGDSRPMLTALLVLEPKRWQDLAASLGVDSASSAALRSPAVIDAVLGRIARCLKTFPSYAQIRSVHLTLDEWTIEDGLLTATMKLRRQAIEQRFADDITAMYADHAVLANDA